MVEAPLAPYLLWAKSRKPAPLDLAGSNLVHCTMEDLPGARDAVDLSAPNDNGYPPVVAAIAAHYQTDPARVVTATGCSGANFIAIAALVGAGDDVLIERPTYDPLIGACRLMGANVLRFERSADQGFGVDVGAVRRALTPRTRLIIVTSPNNPSGVLINRLALEGLADLAASCGAHLLVDEVYLDGACFVRGEPATSRSAARLAGPIIVTSSLTKCYGLAGLRSGWVLAPPDVAERMRRARDVIDNASTGPSDRLAALAWSKLPALQARARALLTDNLALAREFFAARPEYILPEPPGCLVAFPRLAGTDDAGPFVRHLLERHGIAVAPGRFFDMPAHFRVSFAGGTGVISTAFHTWGTGLPLLQ
jgi:hypothetical protein